MQNPKIWAGWLANFSIRYYLDYCTNLRFYTSIPNRWVCYQTTYTILNTLLERDFIYSGSRWTTVSWCETGTHNETTDWNLVRTIFFLANRFTTWFSRQQWQDKPRKAGSTLSGTPLNVTSLIGTVLASLLPPLTLRYPRWSAFLER